MQRITRRTRTQPKRTIRATGGRVPRKGPGGTAPEGVDVTVRVFLDDRGECRVEPKEAHVRPGGTVAFVSEVGPLTVFAPTPARAASLFPRTRGPLFAVPGEGRTLTVATAKVKEPVVYTYSVYCRRHQSFARASFPRMIVG
ncbi:MAG: hypothetical protein PHQ91_15500 [Thermoanaerobaculaceae bacterium]|nr:hypothetical protein [Thermoanaerobaculaceae bacterium]